MHAPTLPASSSNYSRSVEIYCAFTFDFTFYLSLQGGFLMANRSFWDSSHQIRNPWPWICVDHLVCHEFRWKITFKLDWNSKQNPTPRVCWMLFICLWSNRNMPNPFLLDFTGLPGLKPHVAFVPLSSGNDVIGVVLPSCLGIDTFIRLDILLPLIVGS